MSFYNYSTSAVERWVTSFVLASIIWLRLRPQPVIIRVECPKVGSMISSYIDLLRFKSTISSCMMLDPALCLCIYCDSFKLVIEDYDSGLFCVSEESFFATSLEGFLFSPCAPKMLILVKFCGSEKSQVIIF